MRLLLVLALCAATWPALAAPKLGEDSEFDELRSACLEPDGEGDAGTPEAIDEVCGRMDETLSKARAEGVCWGSNGWEKCD